ncbi:sigma-70 family RNA polymerase sigma factor [Candidatus Parcubacteria bacterium]|nr:sigma-70 family RNA polymerase sigma factor [Candidatus Parcubacteria bacterium]
METNNIVPGSGDLRAIEKLFGEIYSRESDAIFRFCLLRTSDRETALDFTQDTFMRFWNSLVLEKDIKNYRTFLFTIARNIVIDFYRKKKSFSLEKMMESASEEGRGGSLQLVAEENVETTVEAEYLVRKIRELPEPYSNAVYLRCVEELKPREISEILGESANVISVRISRGLEQLRNLLHVDVHTKTAKI